MRTTTSKRALKPMTPEEYSNLMDYIHNNHVRQGKDVLYIRPLVVLRTNEVNAIVIGAVGEGVTLYGCKGDEEPTGSLIKEAMDWLKS